jgi:hypothetical protein
LRGRGSGATVLLQLLLPQLLLLQLLLLQLLLLQLLLLQLLLLQLQLLLLQLLLLTSSSVGVRKRKKRLVLAHFFHATTWSTTPKPKLKTRNVNVSLLKMNDKEWCPGGARRVPRETEL